VIPVRNKKIAAACPPKNWEKMNAGCSRNSGLRKESNVCPWSMTIAANPRNQSRNTIRLRTSDRSTLLQYLTFPKNANSKRLNSSGRSSITKCPVPATCTYSEFGKTFFRASWFAIGEFPA